MHSIIHNKSLNNFHHIFIILVWCRLKNIYEMNIKYKNYIKYEVNLIAHHIQFFVTIQLIKQMQGAQAQDLYRLDPIPEQVDETTRQELVQKAIQFASQQKALHNSQFFEHQQFYLVSSKFLQRWKVYVGYHSAVSANHEYKKFFGSGQLPIINEDIVESVNKLDIKFAERGLNVVLKPGLREKIDYIFATPAMWDIMTRGMHASEYIQVNRKVVQTPDAKKVQIYYQKLTVIPISNSILKDVQYEKKPTLLSVTLQFSAYATVQQLQKSIKKQIVNQKLSYEYTSKIQRDYSVKLWLTPQKTQKQILYNTYVQGCKANSTFSYRLYFDGTKLQQSKQLCDYDILQDSILVMEYKQQRTDWIFFNKDNILQSSCSNCRSVQKLDTFCSCKYVAYCSKQCKIKDKTFHEGRCPNNAESQQEQMDTKLSENSRKGITGLRNLGNTCFMNSGLQCISHVLELTEYFLSNKYINDINVNNPLGTKGELCTAFAKMLKALWYGTQSSFSPTQLKRAIGKFQPMFVGYNQHDSGQLITYLLDGLNQDLNRVKQKPYVQTKDYDGRPDAIVAAQQWDGFLKRNQSQIVDLMYGQYRSVVDCPKCSNRSIQFDPFCMCSLPLKNSSLKKMQITYLQKHLIMHKLQVSFDKAWGWTMKQIAKQIKKQINKPNCNLIFYVASYSSCQIIDENRKVSQVRSQYKFRTLYARELQPGQNPSKDVKIVLGNTICHTYYKDQSYRKTLSPYRLYFFNKNTTLKEMHHKIIQYYKDIHDFVKYQQDVILNIKDDQPVRLLAIASSRYSPCEFCDKKSCEGCEIPYNDTPLGEYVDKADKDKIEFELYWRKNDKEIQNRFDEFSEGKKSKMADGQSNFNKGQTSLQECLKLFEQSQTLGEDNAWYCPNCKDFVLAKKQMQIYKAPKILILCLKRFKRKQYSQQKYNILVDFPIQNLDLSQYVINKNLPTHQVNQQQQNGINSPLLYDLFAVSNHFGGTGGGHYTAYCKNPITGQWYDFDDSHVSQLQKKSVVQEGAYILFYRRKN